MADINIPVLTLLDDNGNEIPIPAIQGPMGPTGPTGPVGPVGPEGDVTPEALEAANRAETARKAAEIAQGKAEEAARNAQGLIDDTTTAPDKVWSSARIVDALCPKETVFWPVAVSKTALGHIPIYGLSTEFGPIQEGSGAPSPDNVRNISGISEIHASFCNKNIIDFKYLYVSGPVVRVYDPKQNPGIEHGVLLKANTTYTLSVAPKENISSVSFIDFKKRKSTGEFAPVLRVYSDSATYTPEKDIEVILDAFYSVAPNEDVNMMLEIGERTEYSDSKRQDIKIQFGQTVYGGVMDLVTGKLTITQVMLSFKISEMNNAEEFPGWNLASNTTVADIVGNVLKTFRGLVTNIGDSVSINTQNKYNNIIYLSRVDYTISQSEWKEKYPNLVFEVVLPYAENLRPVIQLTPSQIKAYQGVNTAYADHGDTSMTVYQDPKLVIEELKSAILSQGANI